MKFSSPLFVFSDVDLDYQYSLGYSRVTRVCLSIEFHLPDLPDKFPGGLKGVIPTGLQTAECPKDAGASSRLTSRPPHRATHAIDILARAGIEAGRHRIPDPPSFGGRFRGEIKF
jgi:hypothetical protein